MPSLTVVKPAEPKKEEAPVTPKAEPVAVVETAKAETTAAPVKADPQPSYAFEPLVTNLPVDKVPNVNEAAASVAQTAQKPKPNKAKKISLTKVTDATLNPEHASQNNATKTIELKKIEEPAKEKVDLPAPAVEPIKTDDLQMTQKKEATPVQE